MIKADLVDRVVEINHQTNPELGVTREVAKACVDAMMVSIMTAVSKGDSLYLRRFGNFRPKRRGAKKARNISAGTGINIPAHTIPVFEPSDEFKSQVRLGQPVNQA